MDEFRYDFVWRRIRQDEYARKLEGKFRPRFVRLSHLINWGALSWLYTHATASKQEHHLGVEHNAMRFLANPSRTRHRPSLRAAAHILHWGHPPLSYQTAEALLRAAHVNPEVNAVLKFIVDEVVAFGSLHCGQPEHEGRCAAAILAGERPFELYRWLSAWILKEEWGRLWEAIVEAEVAAGGKEPNEATVRDAVVRTLVCHDDRGFKILSLCNRADYIPRDLLQSGTAWLSLDLDALWESDPLSPAAADEWGLLDSAREYLERRFYATPSALLLHTLTARVIANSFVSANFDVDALRHLLIDHRGDSYYDKTLTSHYREPYLHLKFTASTQLESDWWHVGTFTKVSVPEGSRFDAEDFLVERTGRNRLSFPFSEGHSVFVEIEETESSRPEFAGEGRQYAAVYCHHRSSADPSRARPLLNVLANCENWIQRNKADEIGNAIMSWILNEPVSQTTKSVEALANDIIGENEQRFIKATAELRERSSFVELHQHTDAAFRAELIVDTEFGIPFAGANFFLRLPWRGKRLAAGKSLLGFIRSEAIRRGSEGNGGDRGVALELAVAADQLLAGEEVSHRFLVLNATQWRPDRQSAREWDVIRLDLLLDGRWSLTASECAVNRTTKKDEDAEKRLEILQKALKGPYSDFAGYKTYLATLDKNGDLHYEDAGRSFTPS